MAVDSMWIPKNTTVSFQENNGHRLPTIRDVLGVVYFHIPVPVQGESALRKLAWDVLSGAHSSYIGKIHTIYEYIHVVSILLIY